MNSRKRKKQSHVIATWRRGLVCLGLICALQVQPLTVLADGSLAQADLTDSAVQVNPTDATTQDNITDSAPVSEGIPEDLMGKADDSTPADDAASLVSEDTKNSVPKDSGSDTIPNTAAPDDALTGDDLMADADKEKTVNGIRFTPMKYRQEALVMNDYIAYCGLDCEACEARLATVNNDNELRIKVSKEWSELNGVEITPEMTGCSGCRIPGAKTPYCDMLCPIRQCAREKQMETCGGCPEMKYCEKVGAIIGNNPDARDRLEIAGSE